MTQKQILAALRDYAYDLGAVVSIRKNLREQYEGRVRLNGARDYFVTYAGGTFALVHNVLHSHLERLQELQYAEGVKRGREYEAQLQTAVEQGAAILALVGCRLWREEDTVCLSSPKTGTHSLYMKLGVRPVSDLLAHVVGFAEQQASFKPKFFSCATCHQASSDVVWLNDEDVPAGQDSACLCSPCYDAGRYPKNEEEKS